ncbi:two pore domain potassium channel family protein [Actinospica sp. MGRD01-02]|uniref:Two pore domain potassium channel family protein n=1 Tax=Actinospica acidithermotolerans TaxID=2828514 RepID=A0A941IKV2_9ACTN|nr:potassium channel family protein [Actinospica acidithermotolerans]MBR7828463.1 two pore domain potassium channel family protein [Actinospica acidithermotolerans]
MTQGVPDPESGSSSPPAGRLLVLRTAARTLAVIAGLVVAYYKLPMDKPFDGAYAVGLVLGLVGVAVLLAWQIRGIVNSPHPRLRAVDALASTLTPFLLIYAAAYYLMERSNPADFTQLLTRTDALYFTVTTFSTVGFGDITAHTEAARVIVITQMIGDLLLVGLAARVVVGAVQEGMRRRVE